MVSGKAISLRIEQTTFIVFALILLLTVGCATKPPVTTSPLPQLTAPAGEAVGSPKVREREKRSGNYVILIAEATDSYESLAATYLGDAKLAYIISEFNDSRPIVPGTDIAIPLKPVNPGGLFPDGYQTIPVLCYHQFSNKKSASKINISEEAFDRQMAYLKNNGFNVITLKQFYDFIDYQRRPPLKSVVITIDDGWKTVKTIAYPILKKYGFTAVLFAYTDLIKTRESAVTLSWDDLREMVDSGVIDLESHTVSHADLNKLTDEQIQKELRESQRIIKAKTGVTASFLAYPYGNFNDTVVAAMRKSNYKAGFTVIRGGNAFFYNPYSLNRSMVFNSDRIDDFAKLLETFRRDLP